MFFFSQFNSQDVWSITLSAVLVFNKIFLNSCEIFIFIIKINLIRHFTVHWQVYLHDLTLSYICTMLPDSNKYGAGSAQKQLGIYTYWPVLFNYHTWLKKNNVIKLLFLIFKKFLGRPRFRSVKWIYSACVCLRMLHNEIRNWCKSNKSFVKNSSE